MTTAELFIEGTPTPQGSKRLGRGGRHIIDDNAAALRVWRSIVALRVRRFPTMPDGPLFVSAVFVLRRPVAHYGTGRNAGVVKASAPRFVSTRPDVDKLCRALLDGLTDGGLLPDDARVAGLSAEKRYVDGEFPTPGCWVRVSTT